VQSGTAPQLLGNYKGSTEVRLVDIDPTRSLVCIDGASEMTVLSLSNPAQPARISGFPVMGTLSDLCLAGERASIVTGPGMMSELIIVDLSSPAVPKRLGGTSLMTDVTGLAATTNGYAAVALGAQGLEIIDARQLSNLHRSKPYTPASSVFDVDLQPVSNGFQACLATAQGLEVVHFSSPTNAALLGTWQRSGANATSIRVAGTRAVLASSTTLWAIDITNPAAPVLIAETSGSFQDLDTAGDLVLTAGGLEGLIVWRVDTDEPTPVLHSQPIPSGIQLDWAGAGLGWTLQHTTNLTAQSDWLATPNTTGITATNLPTSAPAQFFRLTKP
jgi:hypothetical protein